MINQPVQHSLSLILGFAIAVTIWPRQLVSCRDFILPSVATFWVMSLVRIYPGRASWLLWNKWIFSVVKTRRILVSKLQWWGLVIFHCMQINDLIMSMQKYWQWRIFSQILSFYTRILDQFRTNSLNTMYKVNILDSTYPLKKLDAKSFKWRNPVSCRIYCLLISYLISKQAQLNVFKGALVIRTYQNYQLSNYWNAMTLHSLHSLLPI